MQNAKIVKQTTYLGHSKRIYRWNRNVGNEMDLLLAILIVEGPSIITQKNP
ncbi:MAG: hypothetical protein K0Q73_4059 [Paenibacillus sp.]|jgi:hypothetical protein|nr:hypothetical protein [Paenibacillus sp.]